MSTDRNDSPPNDVGRNRRGSVTSAAFSNLFQRSNSTSTGPNNGSVTSAMARDQRRRLSVTTLGLSGTSPVSVSVSAPFGGLRRGSISTNNSDSIDENAVDDEDAIRTTPVTPFSRRLSFGAQAMRSVRQGAASPGSNGKPGPARRSSGGASQTPPFAAAAARRASSFQASTALPAKTPSDMLSSAARSDQGFNWSEQLRSRAESSVSGIRPAFGAGAAVLPPRTGSVQHDRAKSVSDMPIPPQQAAALKPKQPERPKPDYMQERILKGDFYMD